MVVALIASATSADVPPAGSVTSKLLILSVAPAGIVGSCYMLVMMLVMRDVLM